MPDQDRGRAPAFEDYPLARFDEVKGPERDPEYWKV
jgi:hypothetical protein